MNPFKLFIATLITKVKDTSKNKASASIYNIELKAIDGKPIDLNQFKGKKILFVNVASKCGFTKQYADLQTLFDTHKDQLQIIGLPCNQFGKQEPGNATDISTFCKLNYGVSFLISEKIDVKGNNQHAIYKWLTSKTLNGKQNSSVKWNFQKYLIDQNGEFLDYFYSITKPNNSKITSYLN